MSTIRAVVHTSAAATSRQLMQFFRDELHLTVHMRAVQAVFCFADAEQSSALQGFTDGLFTTLRDDGLAAVNDSAVLTARLRQAVEATSLRNLTAQFSVGLDPTATVVEFLSRGITLRLAAATPLDTVLHPRAMDDYNAVYRLLLRVKYCKFALDRVHHGARGSVARLHAVLRVVDAGHLRHVRRHSHRMHVQLAATMHFVNALHTYTQSAVVFCGWRELRAVMCAADSQLADVMAAHDAFRLTLLRRLLLQDATARRELSGLLDAALEFADKYTAFFELATRTAAAFAEVYPAPGCSDLPGILASTRLRQRSAGGAVADGAVVPPASVGGAVTVGTTSVAEASSIVLCSALEDRLASAFASNMALSDRFRKVLQLCVAVLHAKVAATGAPHLAELLLTLNFNGYAASAG